MNAVGKNTKAFFISVIEIISYIPLTTLPFFPKLKEEILLSS